MFKKNLKIAKSCQMKNKMAFRILQFQIPLDENFINASFMLSAHYFITVLNSLDWYLSLRSAIHLVIKCMYLIKCSKWDG
jgi:hypothetical protein